MSDFPPALRTRNGIILAKSGENVYYIPTDTFKDRPHYLELVTIDTFCVESSSPRELFPKKNGYHDLKKNGNAWRHNCDSRPPPLSSQNVTSFGTPPPCVVTSFMNGPFPFSGMKISKNNKNVHKNIVFSMSKQITAKYSVDICWIIFQHNFCKISTASERDAPDAPTYLAVHPLDGYKQWPIYHLLFEWSIACTFRDYGNRYHV